MSFATTLSAASRLANSNAPTPADMRVAHENSKKKLFKSGESTFIELPCGTTAETLTPGDGLTFPVEGNNLRVHYEATVSGHESAFDSSRARGAPLYFVLGTGYVLKKVEQILMLMSFGQTCRITLPPDSAYGRAGHPPVVPGGATVIFVVELRAIQV
jgi:FK506-binding protein 1